VARAFAVGWSLVVSLGVVVIVFSVARRSFVFATIGRHVVASLDRLGSVDQRVSGVVSSSPDVVSAEDSEIVALASEMNL